MPQRPVRTEMPGEIELSLVNEYRKGIWSKFTKGIREYDLIQPGDRIAVCISGGKDSMLMAVCMKRLQRYSKVLFEVVYLVMDPGYSGENRRRILDNAQRLQIPVQVFDTRIFESAANADKNPCFLCARLRRGCLYKKAEELGCNKIAVGHHFDDVIETIVMGMMYGSQVQTMMPKLHSENYRGMQLIRPMYLIREEDIISWAEHNGLHFIQCACRLTERASRDDSGEVSKRQKVKALLKELRAADPEVDMNIFRSVENVNLMTLISYHRGEEYHHFLDDYDKGLSLRGVKNEGF